MNLRLFRGLLILFAFLSLTLPLAPLTSPAAARQEKRWVEDAATRRVALVIGNAAYQHGSRLKNPVNDADAMSSTLKSLGFEVILVKDATRREMMVAIQDKFAPMIGGNCIALVYYSGHGIQIDGVNYLLPVDFNAKSRSEVEFEGVAVGRILSQFADKQNQVGILILDACRNNPFKSFTRNGAQGLGKMDAPEGVLIAYATAPGSVADDNSSEANGLYTQELLKQMKQPNAPVEQVFKNTRVGVRERSGKQQVPWEESSLIGDFYFVRRNETVTNNPSPVPIPKPTTFTPPLTLAEYKAQMVTIPAGPFTMGDEDGEASEKPAHQVYLSAYRIGRTEVTVGMWEEFCKATRRKMPDTMDFNANWSRKDHPIVNVSWNEAQIYCKWAGLTLPTEAQWEKAARGTDGRKFPWGHEWDVKRLWRSTAKFGDAGGTRVVGDFPSGASPYGCLDMAGNVWEWCQDYFDEVFYSSRRAKEADPMNDSPGPDKYRILRGGSWINDAPFYFRTSVRLRYTPNYQDVGFRCVLPSS